MSGDDGMNSNTQVPAVRRAWMPVAMPCRGMHLMSSFPKVPALVVPTRYRKPPAEVAGSPRASRAKGKRRSGLIGGEIMSVHDYLDEGVC
jgi:hypothetical protein